MKLDLLRIQFGEDATNGILFIDGVFECYTLEDEVRDVKVHSETAIPEGTYDIKFRKEGGFHTIMFNLYKFVRLTVISNLIIERNISDVLFAATGSLYFTNRWRQYHECDTRHQNNMFRFKHYFLITSLISILYKSFKK